MTPTPEQLDAANRLWLHANGCSGQSRTVSRFLLGLYNGNRFAFDLTDFRLLDLGIFNDCLHVLEADFRPSQEIHDLLGIPGQKFEELAEDWNIKQGKSWR
jgi:hypothetical protein